MGSTGKGKKLHKAISALIFAVSTGCFMWPAAVQSEYEHHDGTVEVPARVILIKKGDEQVGREVTVKGDGEADIWAYGGEPGGTTTTLNINGSDAFVDVYGGYHDDVSAVPVQKNIIEVGAADSSVVGWKVYDDPAKQSGYSTLHIHDTSASGLKMNVIAGHGKYGDVSGNIINIHGGKLNNYVIAAETKPDTPNIAGRLHDNTVNIFADADLYNAKIYGSMLFNDTYRTRSAVMGTNNTLNTYVPNLTIGELGAFNAYNVHVPIGSVSGDTMVTVVGGASTDISSSTVNGILDKTSSLPVGSVVNLLVNDTGITDNDATVYYGRHGDSGLPTGDINGIMYVLEVSRPDANHVVMRIVDTDELHFNTENLISFRVPVLINRGADFLSGSGAASAAQAAGAQVYTPFFAASGSNMRQITGSYVDMRGYSMVLGLSKKIDTEKRRVLIAPVFEYGRGSFDSYLDDGTHGWGKSSYYGMGIVCRTTFNDGKFYETSLRGGRLKSDYSTNDYIFNGIKTRQDFDSSTSYYGAHFGLGREVEWKPNHKFTYYGKFFYNYTGPETFRLSTGQEFSADSVHSERFRLGVRESHGLNEKNKYYFGAAFEYEFDGTARATCNGRSTPAPTARGASGMLEMGWVFKPQGNDKMSIDISAVGWVGRQRGIMGRVGFNWMF